MPSVLVHRRPIVPRRGHGFTLIELLVVLIVLGIMMGIGVPSFRNFVNSQRVKSAATELMTSVLIARSEAVKRNSGVVAITPASGVDWASGWSVAASGTPLHTKEALQAIVVTSYSDSGCGTSAAVANITFGNTGRPAASACFKFSSDSTTTNRCVKVDVTGIPSSGACP